MSKHEKKKKYSQGEVNQTKVTRNLMEVILKYLLIYI